MDLTKVKLMKSLSPLSDKDYTLKNICKLSPNLKSKATPETVPNLGAVSFAEEFEVKYQLSTIKDQQDSMMCVGFSHSYNMEIQYNTSEPLSQYYIYHNRTLSSIDENPFPGFYNSVAERHLLKDGVVPLHYYYNTQECPDGIMTLNNYKTAFAPIAAQYKISAYFKLHNVNELKAFMSMYNVPAIVSIAVYDSVANTKSDGILPKCEGTLQGYHSLCVVGYDTKYLKVINSIGESWGDHGYGYLDYSDPLLLQEVRGFVVENNKSIVIFEGNQTDIVYNVEIAEDSNTTENVDKTRVILSDLSKKQLNPTQKTLLKTIQDFLGGFINITDDKVKIQVGCYESIENAKNLKTVLNQLGYIDAQIIEHTKSTNTNVKIE
jgi:hypothetical protein